MLTVFWFSSEVCGNIKLTRIIDNLITELVESFNFELEVSSACHQNSKINLPHVPQNLLQNKLDWQAYNPQTVCR